MGKRICRRRGPLVKPLKEVLPAFLLLLLFASVLLMPLPVHASNEVSFEGWITTVVGNGDGLLKPRGVTVDGAGNLYIADTGNNVIRKFDAGTGAITIVAGGGSGCTGETDDVGDGCPAAKAVLSAPSGAVFDIDGNMYIADSAHYRIRMVKAATGVITTVAGNGTKGDTGNGGLAIKAEIGDTYGITSDKSEILYLADYGNKRIRKVNLTSGVISTVAGGGSGCTGETDDVGDGCPAAKAILYGPGDVALDGAGDLYIADLAGNRVRKVNATSTIITTVAGTGTAGYSGDHGPAIDAKLDAPAGLVLDTLRNLYIADSGNHVVRVISAATGAITTTVGTSAEMSDPYGVAMDANENLYIADASDNCIRETQLGSVNFGSEKVGSSTAPMSLGFIFNETLQLGSISVVTQGASGKDFKAVTGGTCKAGTYDSGSTCMVNVDFSPLLPGARYGALVLRDASKPPKTLLTLFFRGNGLGPAVAFPPGTINTVAGDGNKGAEGWGAYGGDGGPATKAELDDPGGVTLDGAGNLYIADYGNNRVRVVNALTGIITTMAGTGTAGYSGDGGLATSAKLNGPSGLVVDGSGDLYISDYSNNRVRMVNLATGIITTVAGTGTAGYNGDGVLATSAELDTPAGLAVDGGGNLYIVDGGNHRVREVDAATGVITTVAGNGNAGYSGDGGPATGAGMSPNGIAVDAAGDIYIAEEIYRLRKIDPATGFISTVVYTYLGGGGDIDALRPVAVDAMGRLYIGANNLVSQVNPGTGEMTAVVGTDIGGYGDVGFSGDGGPATNADLAGPGSIAIDGAGNLYITDRMNLRIRKVDIVDPPVLYFGDLNPGSVSPMQEVGVKDTGNVAVDIAKITPSADIILNKSVTTCLPGNLVPSEICTLGIEYDMTAGSTFGTVTLTDNALNVTNATQTIRLQEKSTLYYTTTKLTASVSTLFAGGAVTVTATVTASLGPTPAGTVTFMDGTATLATVTLNTSGVASSTITSLAVGTHSITAVYSGNGTNFGSTSAALPVTVKAEGAGAVYTTTVVSSSTSKAPYGSAVTFTATVTRTSGTGAPTGSVTFMDATAALATSKLSASGIATYATASLAVGAHSITAVYDGDSDDYFSTSAAVTVNITSVAAHPATVNFGQGNSAATVTFSFAAATKVGSVAVLTMGAPGKDFQAATSSGACAAGSYDRGASCTVDVAFKALASGLRRGAIVLYDASKPPNVLAMVPVYGIGALPAIFAPGIISTVAGNGNMGYTGDGSLAVKAELNNPSDVALDGAGNLYIADNANNVIREVNATTGVITTMAGGGSGCSGETDFFGDGCPAKSAALNAPNGVALDGAGNLFIADEMDGLIREVNASTGVIIAVAGNGNLGYSGDGGPATSAELDMPEGVTLDGAGDLYIADASNDVIRKVEAATGVITTVAGGGSGCSGQTDAIGDGCPAKSAVLNWPENVTLDGAGNLYIADSSNQVIRKISATTDVITTVAGGGSGCSGETDSLGDGCLATSAALSNPTDVALDGAGNLYIADRNNDRIREVNATTKVITTVAGSWTEGYGGDGGPATSAALYWPESVVLDNAGNLYLADTDNNRVRKVLNAGKAAATSSLAAGTHSITAVYSGDSKNASSTSPTLSLTVAASP